MQFFLRYSLNWAQLKRKQKGNLTVLKVFNIHSEFLYSSGTYVFHIYDNITKRERKVFLSFLACKMALQDYQRLKIQWTTVGLCIQIERWLTTYSYLCRKSTPLLHNKQPRKPACYRWWGPTWNSRVELKIILSWNVWDSKIQERSLLELLCPTGLGAVGIATSRKWGYLFGTWEVKSWESGGEEEQDSVAINNEMDEMSSMVNP